MAAAAKALGPKDQTRSDFVRSYVATDALSAPVVNYGPTAMDVVIEASGVEVSI